MRLLLTFLILLLLVAGVAADAPDASNSVVRAQSEGLYTQGWSEPVNVSRNLPDTSGATWPAMAVDATGGVIYLVWSAWGNEAQNIYYTVSADAGNRWAIGQPIMVTGANSLRPSLVVGGTSAHASWAEQKGSDPSASTYQWTQAMDETVEVPNNYPWLAFVSRLALGPGGELHMVLQGGQSTQTDILYSRREAGAAGWLPASVVFAHSAAGSVNPAIAVTADGGQVHLVWQENKSTTESAIYYLKGERNGTGIAWQPPQSLSQGITRSVRPAIALGTGAASNPTVHVTWGEGAGGVAEQYVRYSKSTDGGANWSTPLRIDPTPVRMNNTAPTEIAPALVATPDNKVCATWHGFRLNAPFDAEEIYATCSGDGGDTWNSPVNVSKSSHTVSIRPVMSIGNNGLLHVVWQEQVGNISQGEFEIYYTHGVPYAVLMPVIKR
jgi:hypothetical protein